MKTDFALGNDLRMRKGRSFSRVSLQRAGIVAAVAASCWALAACSPSSPVFEDAFEKALKLTPEPTPSYQQIVANALLTFKKQDDLVDLEISDPVWTEHLGGPAWVVCVKFSPKANTYFYTFFIRKAQIAEVRFAVGTDRCSSRTFSPFDFRQHFSPQQKTAAGP